METQQVQVRPIDKLKSIMSNPGVQEQFKNALDENSNLFVASVIDLFTSEKTLQKCSPEGIITEALKAATLKLPINKSLGFAYIVPYKGQAQFQLGYKGMIQLAMRSGVYRYINAGSVFEGELVGEDKLTGNVDLSGLKASDIIIGYFAYIETMNGFKKTMYHSKEDMVAHGERFSKAYSFGPWKTDFDAMARKTMLRKLISTYGQMSIDMATGLANDGDQIVETSVHAPILPETTTMDRFSRDEETVDEDTGEVVVDTTVEPETEQENGKNYRTRPAKVQKYKDYIDSKKHSIELKNGMNKNYQEMIRQMPALKDQESVLQYAKDRVAELEETERGEQPPIPEENGDTVLDSQAEKFVDCPSGKGNVPESYCQDGCEARDGCPEYDDADSKLDMDI